MEDVQREQVVTFTHEAQREIANMRNHVAKIVQWYGEGTPEHTKAADSLAHVLTQVISLGGTIFRTGDLCLGGITDHDFEYGVVWFKEELSPELKEAVGSLEDWPEVGSWSVHS